MAKWLWTCCAPPIQKPRGLVLQFQIRCCGHPPTFTVLGKLLCEASPAPVREGRHGAEAAPVSSGTLAAPQWLGGSHADESLLKAQSSAYTGKYPPAHLMANPLPQGCA